MAKKAKRLTSVLGIDIGSAAIKVCELRSQGGVPIVTALGVTPTPEGSVDQTGLFNPEAVGVALKALVSSMGASTKQSVASLTGTASVMVRVLEVPRMEDAELAAHMDWETERNNPFAEIPKRAYARLTDHAPDNPNQQVVLALASPTAIETLQIALQKGGQIPYAIDVAPLGGARLLNHVMGPRVEGQTVCVVDFGAKSSQVNIYYGNDLVLPRQILVGGEQVTQAIADAMGVGLAEAEEMKRRVAIPASAMVAPTQDAFFNPFAGFEGGYDPNATFGYDANAANATTNVGVYETPPANPFAEPPQTNAFANPGPTPGYATDPVTGDAVAVPPISDPTYDPMAPVPPAGDPNAYDAASYDPNAAVVAPEVPAAPVVAAAEPVDPAFTAIRPVLEEFVAEVSRSIDYVRGQGGDVTMVTLIGGGARMLGLDGYLSAVLGLPVEILEPLKTLSVSAKKAAPEVVAEMGPDFANAIGNALHIFFD